MLADPKTHGSPAISAFRCRLALGKSEVLKWHCGRGAVSKKS